MRCPGAIAFTEGYPDTSSVYAAEGTVAHTLRALILDFDVPSDLYAGKTIECDGHQIEVDETMGRFLEPGIQALRDLGGKLYVETRVDMTDWVAPGNFGTLDAAVVRDDLIVINDLKYGQGVAVSAVNNYQLMIYALNFWWTVARHETKTRKIIIQIDQPRAGGISEWHTTVDHLLIFGEAVRRAAIHSMLEGAPRIASPEACFWCPATATCGEHAQFVADLLQFDLRDEEIFGEPKVTPEQRANVLLKADMVKKWLNKLYSQAMAEVEMGGEGYGLKLIAGRAGDRTWSDEEKVAAILKDVLKENAYERELLSPTKAEKRMKTAAWERVEPFVIRGPTARPSLVPESDPRPAIASKISKFTDFGDEET